MENIIDYLIDPSLIPNPYLQVLTVVKVLSIIFLIFLVILIIFVLVTTKWFKFRVTEDVTEFVKFKPYGSDKYAKEWKKIIKRLDSGIEAEYKLAIMEADAMLDEILQRLGYTEETTEQKLSNVGSVEINNIEELKEARKVRNGVIHDPDYQLSKDKAKEVMNVYEGAFKNLSLL